MRPDRTLGDLLFRIMTATLLGVLLALGGGAAAYAAGLQVFVQTPSGGVVTLEVDYSDSIENVRQKVQDSTGIAPEEQLLSYAGTTLVDGQTVADYDIQPGVTVNLGYVRALTLTSTDFPSFRLDADYAASIDAGPAFSPLTFALTSGTLPDGVAFDPVAGTLAGRPTTAGAYSFTITATRDDGTTLDVPFAGTIAPAAAVPAAPGDTLAETGVDPAVAIGVAGLLLLSGAIALLGRRQRRV